MGLDGTYRIKYRVTAGTGTGTTIVGLTGEFTWVAHRSCTADGCRTSLEGVPAPRTPGDAAAWAAQEWSGPIKCRDNITKKLIGGSYPQREVTTFVMTAKDGTIVTAGTGTQSIRQLAKCPTQAQPLASYSLIMTFRRTGP